jgi:hypothetical protein
MVPPSYESGLRNNPRAVPHRRHSPPHQRANHILSPNTTITLPQVQPRTYRGKDGITISKQSRPGSIADQFQRPHNLAGNIDRQVEALILTLERSRRHRLRDVRCASCTSPEAPVATVVFDQPHPSSSCLRVVLAFPRKSARRISNISIASSRRFRKSHSSYPLAPPCSSINRNLPHRSS